MTSKLDAARAALALGSTLLGVSLGGAASAHGPETVAWTLSAPAADAVKPGSRLTLTLHGAVLEGWHVYGLKQLPSGPTPLRVALDPSDVAKADGAPAGSPPKTVHDPGFNLDTPYYAQAFTVSVPVRVGPHVAAGRQAIPVSVRFQTCNGDICQPPKTVRLTAAITVRADG